MRPGARLKSAVEVLDDILNRHRPASLALDDWGKGHRFAGSGDRNAIGGIVYDALRRRSSLGWAFGSNSSRALVLGAGPSALGLTADEVAAACDGSQYALEPLNESETSALTRPLDEAPDHIKADVPGWLWPSFVRVFGARAVEEGRKLAERAPTDLRVNTLKGTPEKVLKALRDFSAVPSALSPIGVRVPPPVATARTPNLQAEAAFQAGWFEIQDEGSQIAALLAGAGPRLQVLDLCAGAGGKTLALSAMMQNTGQIYAYDEDRNRLKPIFDRIKRAGVRNVQVLKARDRAALDALGPRFDLVLVDAPCTGTGVWRRRPDAKWRLKLDNIADRQAEQRQVLELGASLVKPGGRLVYVTCTVLPEENTDQIEAFLAAHPGFKVEPYAQHWTGVQEGVRAPLSADGRDDCLLLTPASHDTDGFFIAVLRRSP